MTRPLGVATGNVKLNGGSSAARILLVDDDRSLRRAISRALELEGYAVEVAEDGVQALTFFDDVQEPDLVVLDILMPNLDGLTACRAIRTTSRVPILLLTARGRRRRLPCQAFRPRRVDRPSARAPAPHELRR